MIDDEPTFEFDLVFALPKEAGDPEACLDRLFEAGCDDAVIGVGVSGLIALAFARAGADAHGVIGEAISQAKAALPTGSELREVRPDLVSLADVAARLAVSRQALQKRAMPAPSLGGLYRATEIHEVLGARPGRLAKALERAHGWFASAQEAQRLNAQLSMPE